MDIKKFCTSLFNKKLKMEVDNIIVTSHALQRYKTFVKDNEKETNEMLRKKLIRNLLCSQYIKTSNFGIETYRYGNLKIYVKDNIIRSIYNQKGYYPFKIDMSKKKKLDILLGINTEEKKVVING